MFFFNKLNHALTRHVVVACLLVLLISATLFGVSPKKAEATLGIPFGGLSLMVRWCTCSFNWWIIVGPPVGGSYMFQPGASMLYSFYQIYRPGVWLLGLANGYSACMVYAGKGCAPIGGGPVMMIVGTSM